MLDQMFLGFYLGMYNYYYIIFRLFSTKCLDIVYIMSVVMFLYAALLFFILTPAILLRLPPNGSKYTVAIVHALVFALIWELTHKMVLKLFTPMLPLSMSTPITAPTLPTF
jgi:hypothetical protein